MSESKQPDTAMNSSDSPTLVTEPKPLSPEEQAALEKRKALGLKIHAYFADSDVSTIAIDCSVINSLINKRFNDLSLSMKVSDLPPDAKANEKLESVLEILKESTLSEACSLLESFARATQFYLDQRNDGLKIKDLPFKLVE